MAIIRGGGDIEKETARTGLPADLVMAAEGFADVDVYPDNWQTVGLFADIATQWRIGPAGAVGLDYNALGVVLKIRKITDAAELFDGIRIMEAAALESMRDT